MGPKLAGVAIRYLEVARSLAERYEITIAVPEGSEPVDVPARFVTYDPVQPRTLLAAVPDGVAMISPVLWPAAMVRLSGRVRRWVVDLYDPELFETLELARSMGRLERWARARFLVDSLRTALLLGDAFVCASERQRDLWLGALMAVGRLTPEAYAVDPSLRATIDVVPFGLPPAPPPRPAAPVMKGRLPGIGPHDRVVVWAGGMWDWLDPVTAVRAMDLLRVQEPRTRMVFLGGPAPGATTGRAASAARAEARRLGLEGSTVLFHEWVPYDERAGYLLEADVGLTLHGRLVEARFAFRTRLLDHIWTGLPTVATVGDELAETLAGAGAGLTVPPGDVSAVASALRACLDAGRDATAGRFEGLRERFAWPAATRPLGALLDAEQVSRGRRFTAVSYGLRDAVLWRPLRTLRKR
jgi:glycosyltransferase involved in cell wall biosynthesis